MSIFAIALVSILIFCSTVVIVEGEVVDCLLFEENKPSIIFLPLKAVNDINMISKSNSEHAVLPIKLPIPRIVFYISKSSNKRLREYHLLQALKSHKT